MVNNGPAATANRKVGNKQPAARTPKTLVIDLPPDRAQQLLDSITPSEPLHFSVSASEATTGGDWSQLKGELAHALKEAVINYDLDLSATEKADLRQSVRVTFSALRGRAAATNPAARKGVYSFEIRVPAALAARMRGALTTPGQMGTLTTYVSGRGFIPMQLHHAAGSHKGTPNPDAALGLLRLEPHCELSMKGAVLALEELAAKHLTRVEWVGKIGYCTGNLAVMGAIPWDSRHSPDAQPVNVPLTHLPTALSHVREGEYVALVAGGRSLIATALEFDLSKAPGLASSGLAANPKVKVTPRRVPYRVPPANTPHFGFNFTNAEPAANAAAEHTGMGNAAGLGEFLGWCDLVKFAGWKPGGPELEELEQSALGMVERTMAGAGVTGATATMVGGGGTGGGA